jgi:hypothetical protein
MMSGVRNFICRDLLVFRGRGHLLYRKRQTQKMLTYLGIYVPRVGVDSTIPAFERKKFSLLIICVKRGLLYCPALLTQGFTFCAKNVDRRWISRNKIIL